MSATLGPVLWSLVLAAAARPVAAPPPGKVFLTQQEALDLAFEGCAVERCTNYLTDAERSRAGKLSGEECETSVVFAYVARKDGRVTGTAYFDAHAVRTQREVLMIVVAPAGTIARIEVLAFAEPQEYLGRPAFYQQFVGKPLDAELRLKSSIRGVVGATLTARATTQAARRVLALHQVLGERASPAPARRIESSPPRSAGEPSAGEPSRSRP